MKKFSIKKFFTLDKSRPHYKKISPHGYWSALVIVFVTLNLCVVLFGVYTYYQTSTDAFNQDVEEAATTGVRLNEEKLKAILDRYNGKASRMLELQITPRTIVDPSI